MEIKACKIMLIVGRRLVHVFEFLERRWVRLLNVLVENRRRPYILHEGVASSRTYG
jgi:hypothetical protein